MNTHDALQEVSQELKLMAHYLQLVANTDDPGAETARMTSRQLVELHRQIEWRMAANQPDAPAIPVDIRYNTAFGIANG